MRVHWFQHVPFEGLGRIEDWAGSQGHRLFQHRLFENDPLPDAAVVDFLVVMGGTMSVNDTGAHPWLEAEKDFVGKVIRLGKPVLGVCLGAQLIAAALGSRVYPGTEREIGWFPVRASESTGGTFFFPPEIRVFHWHGETFDLPDGAVRLASSPVCANQAFQWGDRVIGTQFHLETTPDSARALVENCREEMSPATRYVQNPEELLAKAPFQGKRNWVELERLLDYLCQQHNRSPDRDPDRSRSD